MSAAFKRYRKRPVVIEAFQWDGLITTWERELLPRFGPAVGASVYGDLTIATLEGDMTAKPGDWLIVGVEGEIYPCKPAIFAATYEAVEA